VSVCLCVCVWCISMNKDAVTSVVFVHDCIETNERTNEHDRPKVVVALAFSFCCISISIRIRNSAAIGIAISVEGLVRGRAYG
jgi:hypothetical protein